MTHIHSFDTWIEEPGHQSRQLEWVCVCDCGFSRNRLAWRVLVTGARNLLNGDEIWNELDDEYRHAEFLGVPMVVVEGQCPHGGADLYAEQWTKHAILLGRVVYHDPMPANWKTLGKIAGPYRNQRMVDTGPNVCLAFPLTTSRGTWDCIRRAESAGIPVKVFEQRTPSNER